jgi:hypothetical protein
METGRACAFAAVAMNASQMRESRSGRLFIEFIIGCLYVAFDTAHKGIDGIAFVLGVDFKFGRGLFYALSGPDPAFDPFDEIIVKIGILPKVGKRHYLAVTGNHRIDTLNGL